MVNVAPNWESYVYTKLDVKDTHQNLCHSIEYLMNQHNRWCFPGLTWPFCFIKTTYIPYIVIIIHLHLFLDFLYFRHASLINFQYISFNYIPMHTSHHFLALFSPGLKAKLVRFLFSFFLLFFCFLPHHLSPQCHLILSSLSICTLSPNPFLLFFALLMCGHQTPWSS